MSHCQVNPFILYLSGTLRINVWNFGLRSLMLCTEVLMQQRALLLCLWLIVLISN